MKKKIRVEDWSINDRLIYLLCSYVPDNANSDPRWDFEHVTVVAWFDRERQLAFDKLLNYAGEPIELGFELEEHLRNRIFADFDPLGVAREWLEHDDGKCGQYFRSKYEPDWDTIAKEQRMDREERKSP
jgi:hypothetical protein